MGNIYFSVQIMVFKINNKFNKNLISFFLSTKNYEWKNIRPAHLFLFMYLFIFSALHKAVYCLMQKIFSVPIESALDGVCCT